jgi:hypothetical protein
MTRVLPSVLIAFAMYGGLIIVTVNRFRQLNAFIRKLYR